MELIRGGSPPAALNAAKERIKSTRRKPKTLCDKLVQRKRNLMPAAPKTTDSLEDLLKKGDGNGGPAADALRKAARIYLEKGDPLTAADVLTQACAKAEAGPIEPKLHAQIELELGEVAERELGRLDMAMDRYQRAFKLDPDNLKAIEAGRRVYRALGDWVQVARLLEIELETAPDTRDLGRRVALLVELGLLRAKRVGDLVGAAVRLEEAVRLGGEREDAKLALAELYISPDFPMPPGETVGPPERAAQLFLELAESRRRNKDVDGEIAYLKRALGADPYHIDAAVRLEKAYLDANRDEELRHFYRLDAPVPRRNAKRALRAAKAGDLEEAIESAVAAHGEGDDAGEAIQVIEGVLAEKNDFARLAAFKQQLVEIAPAGDPTVQAEKLLEVAAFWQRANQAAKQEAALKLALDADPANPSVFKLLVEHLAAKRDWAQLVALAEAGVDAAAPEDQPIRLAELAEIYEKRVGDVGAAQAAWRRVNDLQPSEQSIKEMRRLAGKQDRWNSVIQSLDRELAAAAVGPARADALKRKAQVFRERHELKQAKALLEEALEIKPDDQTLYRALSDLHEHHGDLEGVTRVMKRQLKHSKEKVEKLNLLRRLASMYEEKLDDPDGVVWACEEILGFLPGDRDAFRRLEAAYEKSGESGQESLVGILEKHAQAAATPAERGPVLHKLAALHAKRKEWPKARARLEQLLKLDKNDKKATEAISKVYEAEGAWADAALMLERTAKDAESWKRLARIVDGKLNDVHRAVRAWGEVLEKRPTDREALEALARLARQRGDAQLLDEVLRRRQEHAEGEEAAAIAIERATLSEQRKDSEGARKMLKAVLDDLDPRNLEAHARLEKLERAAGNLDGALRLSERELFLSQDPARKLELSLEIARAWRNEAKNERRALSAFERVLDYDPNHTEALAALSDLYAADGDWERQLVINEHRLGLAEEKVDVAEAVRLNFELALTAEERLHDPEKAFEFFRRAHDLEQTDGTLGELRRVAETHGLWEKMCEVYSTMKGLEPRLRVAEIADEKLNDPKRAFAVLRSSLALDPEGGRIVPELERLSVKADDAQGLLDVYENLIARRPQETIALLRKRADVREKRMKNPSGALDELLRAFRSAPDDLVLLAEIRRLAGVTGRWEDELAVEGFRFHRAQGRDRLEIALDAARLVEEKVKDDLRAFRAFLRAFQLAPEEISIRDDLWRLARKLPVIDEKPEDRPPPAQVISSVRPPSKPAPMKKMPEKEPTLEIKLDDVMFESSPIVVDSQLIIAEEKEKRRDPTVELSINDLMPLMAKKPPANPKTIDLSISDIAVVKRPPPIKVNAAPPPPPRPPMPALTGPHSAWDELAIVILGLDGDPFARLVQVSEMWEKGARDLDRAFDSLSQALRHDPDSVPARQALERLAEANDAWDKLVGVYDALIEETGSASRAVQLLVETAQIREKQAQREDAEERYSRALGIDPASASALERLEALYRTHGRKQELASLLERRLSGLLERMPAGDQRKLRAVELASTYEEVGNTYEAIDAWRRVAEENPDDPEAFAHLGQLYESVGQWSKVVESLTRELDVLDAKGRKEDRKRALDRRQRIGEIYEKELELPERAVEAYEALYDGDPVAAEAALERLYAKLGRHHALAILLGKKSEREGDKALKAQLFERRAVLLTEKLGAHEEAVEVLRQLRKLKPEDGGLETRYLEALEKAGRIDELAEALKIQIAAAGKRKAPKPERARLLTQLARIEAQLGAVDEAQRSLEKALELEPSSAGALAELARLREGGSDWDGYAKAREAEAEAAGDGAHAVVALLDAARVHADKRNDTKAARRALERAVEKEPKSREALAALGAILRKLDDALPADEIARRELGLDMTAPERAAQLHVELGQSALGRGALEDAARAFREALAQVPGFPRAVNGMADVAARTGAWDEVEAFLRDAAARDGVPVEVAAQFHRRLADAAERQGHWDEASNALLEADRLVPGDVRTRLQLGENRYKQNRFREAAQYLGALIDHPDLKKFPAEAGPALYHAALSELKLRRPEKALPLLERAVEVAPENAEALGLLAERIIEAGDLQRAVALLEQQAAATAAPGERATRWERVADVVLSDLRDEPRACAAFEKAVEAAGEGAPAALLEKTLRMERQSGQLERAAATAARLLDKDAPPQERARRLREAASLDAALGRTDDAKARLRQSLELDPLAEETLAGLSAMLVSENLDEEAATLLTRALPRLSAPKEDVFARAGRATLWMRLGECRERLRDARGATAAFEKALDADPSRRALRETIVTRYGDDPTYDEGARAHRLVLLADDPLHVPSLRAMAKLEARRGARDGGRRFLELLAVAGDLNDEERLKLSAPIDDSHTPHPLDEEDHEALAHPEAIALAPVFAALYEGAAGHLEDSPDLAALGVKPDERVSPVAATDLARMFSDSAIALGNRKTGLYVKADFADVRLVAHPPPAIVVGPGFSSGKAPNDVRFLLGRALEISRPEYILASALERDSFTKLFAAILRAFHPRHARHARDEEAAKWKRALPYKAAKKLAELFAEGADTQFSSARWRRAVQHTGNRAGLVVSGDMIAAARVLYAEGDKEAVRELARFAASDDYMALRTKLTLR
jgi:tetratricopeptide (TPR) repeat protein